MKQTATAFFPVGKEETEPDHTNALGNLSKLVQSDIKQVNELIFNHIENSAPFISQLCAHLIAAGGKRLRSILTIAAAKLCEYNGESHIRLAASVEFIHNATLLHDDVIDDSLTRRGQPSTNALWGSKASILVGDFLFTQAFQLMVSVQSNQILDILAKTAATITEGEIRQLQSVNNLELTQNEYLSIIKAKTAELFSAACTVGAVLANRTEIEISSLAQYGFCIGIAFQLTDDILDYKADQFALGKKIGNDFREGKMTLPVILAYKVGDKIEQAFWRRTMQELNQSSEDFDHAVFLIMRHHSFNKIMDLAKEYAIKAKKFLDVFEDSLYKKSLQNLADFCLQRQN